MATCLNCGSQHARVKDSRVIPADDKLSGMRVLICPVCGPRSQEIRDTGPAPKATLSAHRDGKNQPVATGSHG